MSLFYIKINNSGYKISIVLKFKGLNPGGGDNPSANQRPMLTASNSTASGPAEAPKKGGDTDRSAVSSKVAKNDQSPPDNSTEPSASAKTDSSPPGNLTDRSTSSKSDQPSDTTLKEEVASSTDSGRASPSQVTSSGTLSRASSETSGAILSREDSEETITLGSGNSSRRESSSGVVTPGSAVTEGNVSYFVNTD